MSTQTLVSTTDTVEQMRAAMGLPEKPAAQAAPPEETPPTTPETPPPDDDAGEPAPAAEPTTPEAKAKPATPAATPPKQTKAEKREALAEMQARIDAATREKYDQQRATEAALQKADSIQRELEALRARQLPTPETKPTETPAVPTKPEPKSEDFASFEEFNKATTAWMIEQQLPAIRAQAQREIEQRFAAERQQAFEAQQRAVQQQIVTTHQNRWDAARHRIPDFDTVIQQGANLPRVQHMTDVILHSDVGPEMSHYLCAHPEECVRIANLPPLVGLKEMGALEYYVKSAYAPQANGNGSGNGSSASAPAVPATPAAPVSRVPAPPATVGRGVTRSTVPLDDPNLSFAEYDRRREEQARAARR